MIKARLRNEMPFKKSEHYTDKEKEEINLVNEIVCDYFWDNKIELPLLPIVGMKIDISSFYKGNIELVLDTMENDFTIFEIEDIVIHDGFIELYIT